MSRSRSQARRPNPRYQSAAAGDANWLMWIGAAVLGYFAWQQYSAPLAAPSAPIAIAPAGPQAIPAPAPAPAPSSGPMVPAGVITTAGPAAPSVSPSAPIITSGATATNAAPLAPAPASPSFPLSTAPFIQRPSDPIVVAGPFAGTLPVADSGNAPALQGGNGYVRNLRRIDRGGVI